MADAVAKLGVSGKITAVISVLILAVTLAVGLFFAHSSDEALVEREFLNIGKAVRLLSNHLNL